MRVRRSRLLRPLFLAGLLAAGRVAAHETTAVSANDFLSSIGVCVHVQHHHQPAWAIAPGLKYIGARAVRDGADGNFDMTGLLLLHQQAGVKVVFGPGSGAHDEGIAKTIAACRQLAAAGALLAIEGPNEPNNFGGEFQRDLYRETKSDPVLQAYPVYGPSECGAEEDNVGLQFLINPRRAHTLMPAGTRYADYLNCHNYVCGQIQGMIDNQATRAAATKSGVAIDDLFGNHGLTWRKKFTGYTESELDTITKVTTETGWVTDNTPDGDDRQGKVFLNVYLAQYQAGWKHTFVYEFADDADGAYGFYRGDLTTPRKAADYLHNFTSILADPGVCAAHGKVGYSIWNRPSTVHDLLMEKSDGTFELAVWDEQVKGSSDITVKLDDRYDTVRVYDPTIGATPTQTLTNVRSVPLTASDHVLVLEFKQP
jgi:hypothetical protein